MPFTHRTEDQIEIFEISGALDASEAPKLRDEFKRSIDDGHSKLLVDLAGVQFVDSSGLSVLVTALKSARAANGDVVLLNLTPAVRSIIELTRLHKILEICDDEAAARAKLGA